MTRAATAAPLTDADICWTMSGAAPWPPSRPVLDVAIAALPLVEDALGAEAVEQLAATIADLRVELRAVREVLSVALAMTHTQAITIRRQRERIRDLRQAQRRG